MIDYSKLTIEAFENKLKSSNDRVREFFNSEEFVEKVSAISYTHNFDLSRRENLAFHKLAAATILGFIKPEELPEAILTFIETDEETAQSAANEIKKIIPEAPQAQTPPQAQQTEQTQKQIPPAEQQPPTAPTQTPPPIVETPTETPIRPDASEPIKPKPLEPKPNIEPAKTTEAPTQPTPQKTEQAQQPHLTKAPNPQEQSAKPFVIHEDVEVKPGTEQNVEEEKPIRPIFYKPSFNADNKPKPSPTKVKVDLGNKESLNPQAAPKRKDYTIHTPQETSEKTPKEPTGPVSNSEPQKNSEEVHPENIVDLKDLPR